MSAADLPEVGEAAGAVAVFLAQHPADDHEG